MDLNSVQFKKLHEGPTRRGGHPQWPFRIEELNLSSMEGWIWVVFNSKSSMKVPLEEVWNLSMCATICCDVIWMQRNRQMVRRITTDPMQGAHHKLQKLICKPGNPLPRYKGTRTWTPLPPPSVKVNFDAALTNNQTCVATDGHDHKNDIICFVSS